MDLTAAIEQARQLQRAIMTDTVVLEVEDGWTTDELGTRTTVWRIIYPQAGEPGIGLVQAQRHTPRETDSAGIPVTVQSYVAKLPHTVTLPDKATARIRVAASLDAANVGTYTVLADETQGWATARRIICRRAD